MRRTMLMATAIALLAGCSADPEPQAAPASTTDSSAEAQTTSAPEEPTGTTRTPPAYTGLFDAVLVQRGLTPAFGTPTELQATALDLCSAYDDEAQAQFFSDLVNDGWELSQTLDFNDAATSVFCPEYFTG